jgi:hypothetical protein
MGFNLGKFFNSIGAAAGHALGALPKGIVDVTSSLGNAVKGIPIVGPLFHGVLGIAAGPFDLSERVLNGERVDHALVDNFKEQIGSIKEVAPYAQAVVSFVPGVGTVASAALGAGLAIASGQKLDTVVMSAVRGAVPGGALGVAAFDVGRDAIRGKLHVGILASVGMQAVGNALGVSIPPAAAKSITGGLNAIQSIASSGKGGDAALRAADALVEQGENAIPGLSDSQRKLLHGALQTGLAVQHASNLQSLTVAGVRGALPQLANDGFKAAGIDSTIAAARQSMQGVGTRGFDAGIGTMLRQTTPHQASAVRSRLSPTDAHGFDVAASHMIGRVLTHPDPPDLGNAAAHAGYATAKGSRASGDISHRKKLLKTAASNPEGRRGAEHAANEAAADGDSFFATLWHAFKKLLGLEDEAKAAFFKKGDELAAKSGERS